MTTLQESKSFIATVRLWPQVSQMDDRQQLQAVQTIVQLLYLLPFALIGLVWLILGTDYGRLSEHLEALLILFIAMLLLLLQPFNIRVRLGEAGNELNITSSLAPMVMWSTLFISGAAGVWAMVLAAAMAALWRGNQLARYGQNPVWSPLSTFVQQISIYVFPILVAATIHLSAGGSFPITGADAGNWLPAFLAILIGVLLSGLIMLPVTIQVNSLVGTRTTLGSLFRNYASIVALPLIMSPFAIIIALLNTEGRTLALFFILIGIYLVNRLAHHMSQANAQSRQRAWEFAQLQALGEAIIQSPADASALPKLLIDYLPRIFPVEKVEVRLFEPDEKVVWSPFHVSLPASMQPISNEVWNRLRESTEPTIVVPKVVLPGQKRVFGDALAVKITTDRPGLEASAITCIGGVYLLRHRSVGETLDSLATAQSLASQVASVVYRAEVFSETLAFHKAQQELEFAGRVQTSFLPDGVPEAEHWQIAATLESARQTSGDFYDFIPLADGRLGIVVADVSDKGTGAALYMALSRTLIRTYAMEETTRPEIALRRANDRIRADTESDQFVTLIYGILDTASGLLTYANAGHNPGYVLRKADGRVDELTKTGIPLGMFEGMAWQQAEVHLDPGDVLLLYTDGVTEAQDAANNEYGEARLQAIGKANMGRSAEEIQEAVIASIHDFVGEAPQFDDITLMVINRDLAPAED